MKKQRKHYTPEEKVAILRRHLLEKEPISKLCDELGLQPTVFYRWQKEFFENGAAAFEQKEANQPFRRAGADRFRPRSSSSIWRAAPAMTISPPQPECTRIRITVLLFDCAFQFTRTVSGAAPTAGSELIRKRSPSGETAY